MVVGNMGTSGKMNYTIMGNAVNLAARLEGVNKQYGTGILISEYTKNEIDDEFVCRSLDRVRVVGISTPLRLYELLGLRNEAVAPDAWEEAMALYEKREFAGAEKHFASFAVQNKEDRPALMYLDKCRLYMDATPPAGWDGVNNLSQK
jgi:adenylate cyclase